MLKTIPKSNINLRTFKVHKKFVQTEATDPIYVGELASDGAFESSSAATTNGISNHSLYASIKHKYYRNDGNVFNTFGKYNNLGLISLERELENKIRVISIPQSKRGLGIKPGSVELLDTDTDIIYKDTADGTISSDTPQYTITNLDFSTGEISILDSDNETFTGTITSLDLESGIATMTFDGDTNIVDIVLIDLENGILKTAAPLEFEGLDIDAPRFGNIFYSDGLIVLGDSTNIVSYNLEYRSTETITEQEVLITAKAGEFNYSQNPSAVEVEVSGSYDFVTTAIPNISPARTRKITEINSIKRREFYSGSVNHSISGSWDDYYESSSIDKVGSYLSTYISTIGLYDADGDMIAVAKLPKPIKNLPNYDVNFIVRFDV
jgi:hypothetical protein